MKPSQKSQMAENTVHQQKCLKGMETKGRIISCVTTAVKKATSEGNAINPRQDFIAWMNCSSDEFGITEEWSQEKNKEMALEMDINKISGGKQEMNSTGRGIKGTVTQVGMPICVCRECRIGIS